MAFYLKRTSDKIKDTMSYKVLTIDMLTSNENKNSTVYPGLLKAGFCYFLKKFFPLMQVGTENVPRSTVFLLFQMIVYLSNDPSIFLSYNLSYSEKKLFD